MWVGIVLYSAGALVFTFMPAYLGAIGTALGASPTSLGTLAAAELWAIAFASLMGPFWIGRLNWRVWARIGAIASLLGQCISLSVSHFQVLLIVRLITGVLGEGVLMALSYSLLGQTAKIDRSFGMAYAVATVIGTTCLYFSPQIDRVVGKIGVLVVLAVMAVLALLISFLMPRSAQKPTAENPESSSSVLADTSLWRNVAVWVSVAQAVWYAGAGSFWSFAEQLAAHNAVPGEQIAKAMGIGTAAALIGTLLPIIAGSRLGRRGPTIAATFVMAVAIFAFTRASGLAALTMELAVFNIFWACGTIYLTAAACSFDRSGKIAVLLPAFQTIGMAVGTFVLGHSIGGLGFYSAPWVTNGFLVLGMVLAVLCITLAVRALDPSNGGCTSAQEV